VSAAGESLTYYIVITEFFARSRAARKAGFRVGRELILKSNLRPYVKAESFLDYIKILFLLDLVAPRGLAEFAAEDAV
jgi:hypothetical protein